MIFEAKLGMYTHAPIITFNVRNYIIFLWLNCFCFWWSYQEIAHKFLHHEHFAVEWHSVSFCKKSKQLNGSRLSIRLFKNKEKCPVRQQVRVLRRQAFSPERLCWALWVLCLHIWHLGKTQIDFVIRTWKKAENMEIRLISLLVKNIYHKKNCVLFLEWNHVIYWIDYVFIQWEQEQQEL